MNHLWLSRCSQSPLLQKGEATELSEEIGSNSYFPPFLGKLWKALVMSAESRWWEMIPNDFSATTVISFGFLIPSCVGEDHKNNPRWYWYTPENWHGCPKWWVGKCISFQTWLFWVHPWRLTWNIIMEVWKIIFLSKWVICRFHVNLPGCSYVRFQGCIFCGFFWGRIIWSIHVSSISLPMGRQRRVLVAHDGFQGTGFARGLPMVAPQG